MSQFLVLIDDSSPHPCWVRYKIEQSCDERLMRLLWLAFQTSTDNYDDKEAKILQAQILRGKAFAFVRKPVIFHAPTKGGDILIEFHTLDQQDIRAFIEYINTWVNELQD